MARTAEELLVVRMEATLARFERQLKTGVRSARKAATDSEKALSGIGRNVDTRALGQSFSQMMQAISAGTRPVNAFSTQLADVSMMFGPMGMAIGAIAGVALPSLVSALGGAGDEAEDVQKELDDLRKSVDAYKSAQDNANLSTEDAIEKWGRLGPAIRAGSAAYSQVAQANAFNDLDAALTRITEKFGGLGDELISGFDTPGLLAVTELPEIERTIQSLSDELSLTEEQARAVIEALADIAKAEGLDAKAKAATDLSSALLAVFGNAEAIPLELREIAAEADAAAKAAGEIAAIEMADPMRDAAEQAFQFARHLAGALEMAQQTKEALDGMGMPDLTAGQRASQMNARVGYQTSRGAGVTADRRAIAAAVAAQAQAAGLDPGIILALMGVESGLNPRAVGGAGGNYQGLIQFGPWEREHYGVGASSSVETQVAAAIKFLLDRGVQPGEQDPARYYAAVLAGNANRVNAGDVNNGGRVSSVSSFVQGADWQEWYARGQELLRASNGGMLPANGAQEFRDREAEQLSADAMQAIERAEAEAAREREQAAKDAADEAQRLLDLRIDLRDAASQATEDAQFEASLVGKTAAEVAALRAEYVLMNQAREAGIDLNERIAGTEETYGEMIRRTAVAVGEASIAEQQRAAVLEETSARQEFLNSQYDTFVQGLTQAIVAGEGFDAVLQNLIVSLAQATLQAALFGSGPFGGSSGTGLLGGFLGPLFGADNFDGGGFTGSGPRAGDIDGRGGFPAILHRNETVLDHNKGQGMAGADVRVWVDDDLRLHAAVDRRASRAAGRAVAIYDKGLSGRVKAISADPWST